MTKAWDPQIVGAMKGRPRFQVVVSRSQVAASLWDYAEDELADRAATMSHDELAAIRRIDAVFDDATYPLPMQGQRITNNHVIAFAAVASLKVGCGRCPAPVDGPRSIDQIGLTRPCRTPTTGRHDHHGGLTA